MADLLVQNTHKYLVQLALGGTIPCQLQLLDGLLLLCVQVWDGNQGYNFLDEVPT
jgi:hypothetical protein